MYRSDGTMVFRAMCFAREAHEGQKRKYTGNPYTDHLAEVAGTVASVDTSPNTLSAAWLHDVIEDTEVTQSDLASLFPPSVVNGVMLLSDLEEGSRKERKAAQRWRLSAAPGWVQTVKCADIISNTSSIVEHDPKFAETYLEECKALLDVLEFADYRLKDLAHEALHRTSKRSTI